MEGFSESVLAQVRTAWVPEVGEGDGDLSSSKLCGVAAIPEGEVWPSCPNCERSFHLFLQLNAKELPPEAPRPFGPGILQMFYCLGCEEDCETYLPFSRAVLIRVISEGAFQSIGESPAPNPFPAKRIVGWKPVEDLPNWEEIATLGVELTDAESKALDDFPHTGEKFLGWPYWVQGLEYPNCPDCNRRMEFLFQIDSEVNIPYMFGDAGCGHITICPEHPERITFAWACC